LNVLLFTTLFNTPYGESGTIRFLKLVFVVLNGFALSVSFVYIDGMGACFTSFYYITGAIGTWTLLFFGSDSKLVAHIYFIHDSLLGMVGLSVITVLSALYVPGKIQTWLLYNNALSRGVVIEDILRANSSHDDQDDDLTFIEMQKVLMKQSRMIAALTNGSDSDDRSGSSSSDMLIPDNLTHTLSDNVLFMRNNVSDNDLSDLKEASSKLQRMMNEEQTRVLDAAIAAEIPFHRMRRANSSGDMSFANVVGRPPMSHRK